MDKKKLYHVCKNIVFITITICLLIYFIFAERSLHTAYANVAQDTEESVEESEILEEEPAENESAVNDGMTIVPDSEASDGELSSTEAEVTEAEVIEAEVNSDVVVASITYSYEVYPSVEYTENSSTTEDSSPAETLLPEIITESEEYYTLDEAFSGAAGIAKKLENLGIKEYLPSIQLIENIELSDNVSNTDNASFILDFNGHWITLSKEAYIDFGSGNITFTDEQYREVRELETSEQQVEEAVLGGVKGAGLYMITGTGNMSFETGYYISDGGIIDNANTIAVNGGFYSYDISCGMCRSGDLVLPDGMALVKTEIVLGDVALTGFMPGLAGFRVSVDYSDTDGKKEITSYFVDFAGAWEEAITLSSTHDMAPASISIYNEEIKGVSISQSYDLMSSDLGQEAVVSVNGINMKRADGYEGTMFVVNGGKLVLDSCSLDGSLLNDAVSDSSLIRVSGSAKLSLKDTSVENNCSMVNEKTGDKGAGIYLAADSSMTVSGQVRVFGNTCYSTDSASSESEKTDRNVYIEDGASIIVDGAIAGTEGSGHIGITHENGIIAGFTRLGKLSAEFLEEILSASEDNSIYVDDVLETLTSDDHPSYYLTYDSENNSLYWDTSTRYLPEAGIFRLEIVLLLIGLLCFICRNIMVRKRNVPVYATVTVVAILCLLGGTVAGAAHLRMEKELYYENMRVVEQMEEKNTSKTTTADVKEAVSIKEAEKEEIDEEVYAEPDVPDDGREYYGIVEIPELGIKLPVLAEYSDANMKTTPCVYYGDIRDQNLVIVGHNYESQFSGLNDLDGDINVILTLMDGSVHSYKSCAVEALEPDDVDGMLLGEWDLTLFTCNYAGDRRIAVRCVAD